MRACFLVPISSFWYREKKFHVTTEKVDDDDDDDSNANGDVSFKILKQHRPCILI
jgi:hypothetical protein